jgi:hypothetical protein
MNKYDKKYIEAKMADFNEFNTALRATGTTFNQVSAVILYSIWKR